LSTSQADATATASSTAIKTSQAGWWGSAPVANARRLVRAIRRSLSYSTYWLNAPALADAISTDSASTSACTKLGAGPWRHRHAYERGDHDQHADAQLEQRDDVARHLRRAAPCGLERVCMHDAGLRISSDPTAGRGTSS
jgi:hypothetical protein